MCQWQLLWYTVNQKILEKHKKNILFLFWINTSGPTAILFKRESFFYAILLPVCHTHFSPWRGNDLVVTFPPPLPSFLHCKKIPPLHYESGEREDHTQKSGGGGDSSRFRDFGIWIRFRRYIRIKSSIFLLHSVNDTAELDLAVSMTLLSLIPQCFFKKFKQSLRNICKALHFNTNIV